MLKKIKQPHSLEKEHIEEVLDEITDLMCGDEDVDDYPETIVHRRHLVSDDKVERIIAAHEY